MNRFQESGALQYSERVYKQMLEIDSKQQWMTDSDHLAGAMAANCRGIWLGHWLDWSGAQRLKGLCNGDRFYGQKLDPLKLKVKQVQS